MGNGCAKLLVLIFFAGVIALCAIGGYMLLGSSPMIFIGLAGILIGVTIGATIGVFTTTWYAMEHPNWLTETKE